MSFDAARFAEEFKKTIDWIYAQDGVRRDLERWVTRGIELRNDPHYFPALRLLIELLFTHGMRFGKKAPAVKRIVDFWQRKHGMELWTPAAQDDLIAAARGLTPPKWLADQVTAKIPRLLKDTSESIPAFTHHLYQLAQRGKTDILGPVGADTYLRDFGYWDIVPVGFQEKRFQARTGLYPDADKVDPEGYKSYQDHLRDFCSRHLTGKKVEVVVEASGMERFVEPIDLGNTPGVVDWFIYVFCAEPGAWPDVKLLGICADVPKCNVCRLNGVCVSAFKPPTPRPKLKPR